MHDFSNILNIISALPTHTNSKEDVNTNSCSNIEFSNLSLENSLIQPALNLNSSHILSCSKLNTSAISFKSLDIIDICGHQQLFKAAFKQLMNIKKFGFCLGLQQQNNKRKPLIGGNLLLNQIGAAEKPENALPILCQIDDINYLDGIAFCCEDTTVFYMNMQTQGTCKEITPAIKCKYLQMLLKESNNTLYVYDSKEQLKMLRKALPDLKDICVTLQDPKVANWLLQPDKPNSFSQMVFFFN